MGQGTSVTKSRELERDQAAQARRASLQQTSVQPSTHTSILVQAPTDWHCNRLMYTPSGRAFSTEPHTEGSPPLWESHRTSKNALRLPHSAREEAEHRQSTPAGRAHSLALPQGVRRQMRPRMSPQKQRLQPLLRLRLSPLHPLVQRASEAEESSNAVKDSPPSPSSSCAMLSSRPFQLFMGE